jgi:hypothetical protein
MGGCWVEFLDADLAQLLPMWEEWEKRKIAS